MSHELVRVGTRGSRLALWQAELVAERLRSRGHDARIVEISTTGDLRTDVPLSEIGGKGLFLKELENALRADEIDIAVHSLKDVPTLLPDDMRLLAFVERADPRDVWIAVDGSTPESAAPGTRVGTSSPRRRAQLATINPNLEFVTLRGNVPTRLSRLSERCEATVLAAAGLDRLDIAPNGAVRVATDVMVPAPGQGVITVEALEGRMDHLREILDDPTVREPASAERAILDPFTHVLDCTSPVGVHVVHRDDRWHLEFFASDPGATRAIRFTEAGRELNMLVERARERAGAEGLSGLLS